MEFYSAILHEAVVYYLSCPSFCCVHIESIHYISSLFCRLHILVEVLGNSACLGYDGPRTMFAIEMTSGRGRVISALSMMDGEEEVLLPPNISFIVIGLLVPSADGLVVVQLKEEYP